MRTLSLALAALLIAAATGPALAAGPGRQAHARQFSQTADNQFENSPHKAAALQKAEQRGMFGQWTKDGNVVHGRFVKFNLTGETGTIADFSYRNGTGANYRKIFTEVEFADFTRDTSAPGTPAGVRLTGSILRVYGTDGILRLHNNPGAGVRFQNGDVARDVTFQLAPGVTAGSFADGDKSLRLNLTGFGFTDHAHVVVTNGTITKTTTFVKVSLAKNATLAFLLHPKVADAAALHRLISAIAKGRLGAAADLVVVNGVALVQADDIDVGVRAGNVTGKRAQLFASGEGVGARVVMVTLSREDFPDLKNGSLEVRLAGAKINLADEAAVHAATGAAANVTIGKDAIVVLVNVPHFSEQEIVVQATETTAGGNMGGGDGGGGIPGFALFAALAALALVAVGRRRNA